MAFTERKYGIYGRVRCHHSESSFTVSEPRRCIHLFTVCPMDAPGHPVFCMVDVFEDEKMENWKW